jgi:uncharacterized protein YgiM (DUF1202 family)
VNVLRNLLAWGVTTAALAAGSGIGVGTGAEAATATWIATTSVNVRTGPGTTYTVLDQLAKGEVVLALGKASGGWLPIDFDNTTAYLFSSYVATTTAATPVTAGPAGTPGIDGTIATVLGKGTRVTVTGRESAGYSEATVSGTARWIHSGFLSATTDTTASVVADATTTSLLTMFAQSGPDSDSVGSLAKGAVVGVTGEHSRSFSRVVSGKLSGWAYTGYLKVSGTDVAALPVATARRSALADAAVLTKADAGASTSATVEAGEAVLLTGKTSGTFTQVIWDGGTAWVATSTLASSETPAVDGLDLGSSSLNKLEPNGKVAVLAVREQFPQIKTMYGWRASSDYSSDHPNGRAVDVMIPDWKSASGKALGKSVAKYFITNYSGYRISYIIWRQRTWTPARGTWKKMEDRGSPTANHKDHVHLSFEKS